MADTSTQDPLLDLNTLIERPTIKIDGDAYEILSQEELSILDSQRFERWGRKIEELANDDGKADELDALLDTVTEKIMVGVPEDVRSRLTSGHKVRVISVFTGLLLGGRAAMAGATMDAMNRSIGAKTSLDSSDFSAAIPDGGSKTSPPAS